jgi:hypothetical protein
MTDNRATDEPVPPPASPYGPADGVEQLFGVSAEASPVASPVVAPATTGDSPAVTRARRTIGLLAIVLPIIGLLLCLAAIVVQVSTGGSIFGIDVIGEIAGFTLTFLGPTLLVLGLHMVIWRALVRPLARMESSNRTVTIIGVGALLSFVSVILVFVIVFLGFILVSGLLDATNQSL